MVTLLFAMMFKWLPDTYVAWRDVWPGAVSFREGFAHTASYSSAIFSSARKSEGYQFAVESRWSQYGRSLIE
jgi:uncharacterized BrkB/YihY/UPF0761 family membrane protein